MKTQLNTSALSGDFKPCHTEDYAHINADNYVVDKTFCKIVAATDMMLFRYPKHQWASLRVMTINCRHKDCSILDSLPQLSAALSLTTNNLMEYVYSLGVSKDVDRVFHVGQEVNEAYSYVHYIAAMGLTTKSPYSARINPSLHTWIHTIGAGMGSMRSMNTGNHNCPNQAAIVYMGM